MLSFLDGGEQHVNAKRSPVKSQKKTATSRGGDGKIHCVKWVHFLKTVQVRGGQSEPWTAGVGAGFWENNSISNCKRLLAYGFLLVQCYPHRS